MNDAGQDQLPPVQPPLRNDTGALAVLRDVAATGRRIIAGPDGPLTLGILLSLGVMVEVTTYGASGSDAGEAMAVNLLATAPLLFARRFLLLAAAATTFAVLVTVADPAFAETWSATIALFVVLYLVAGRYSRIVSALFTVPFLFNVMWPYSGDDPNSSGVLLLVLVVAAQVLGDSQRQKGSAIAERDATKLAMADTVRVQTAMGERARIARELHDVVAHHLSVIAVQAETGRLTTPGITDEGRQRFLAIGNTARDALSEMRRLLGVMRADAGADAGREPQPGLDRLAELVDMARLAGNPVRLVVHGEVQPLPPGMDLTAYRIVQEALTNNRRHAPGAHVDVELAYGLDALRVRVRDHGPGPSGIVEEGHGLTGMRERVAMVGGGFEAGPAEGGGFAVTASLPILHMQEAEA